MLARQLNLIKTPFFLIGLSRVDAIEFNFHTIFHIKLSDLKIVDMVQELVKVLPKNEKNITFSIKKLHLLFNILLPTSNTPSLCSSLKSKYYSIFDDLAHIFKFFRNLKFRQKFLNTVRYWGVFGTSSEYIL